MESLGRFAIPIEAGGSPPELHMYSRIGTHLRDHGLLSMDQVETILSSQKQSGLRFGEEAMRLGLLDIENIDIALRRQFNVNILNNRSSSISNEVVAAYWPETAGLSPICSLRTILLSQHIRENEKGYTLAISSAHRREGRSVFAANLAVLFSQAGVRTLLMDADLRNPKQHELFGLNMTHGLSSALARHSLDNLIYKIDGLGPLAILPAGIRPPNPEQLLNRQIFLAIIADLRKQFDVLIIDTPAIDSNEDAIVIAERASNVIILAEKNKTQSKALTRLITGLNAVKANIIGTVLRNG